MKIPSVLGKIKPIMKTMLSNEAKKMNPKNIIELHKEKEEQLMKLIEIAKKSLESSNSLTKNILNSNKEIEKLNKFYNDKISQELKKQEEIEAENKKIIYREEFLISDIKGNLEANVSSLQQLKEDCINLQKDCNKIDYQLKEIKQKKTSYQNKIDYFSLELNEKIKLKQQKQNELNNINAQIEQTKKEIEELSKIDNDYIDYLRMLHNDYQESKGNIRVFCRVRPPLIKEANNEQAIIEYPSYNSIILHGPLQKSNIGKTKDTHVIENYKFDRVFTPNETQEDVFKEISQLVQSALDGYKVCILHMDRPEVGKHIQWKGRVGITGD